MSRLENNLETARQCINYLTAQNIKSINVWFRRGTYQTCSDYHYFLLGAARAETHKVPEQVLKRKRKVIETLADTVMTKKQKRTKIKEWVEKWGVAYFDQYTPTGFFSGLTRYDDESRIRSVRRSIQTEHGNCNEKSAVCATWLLENSVNKVILWVGGGRYQTPKYFGKWGTPKDRTYDHAWVMFDTDDEAWNGNIDQLPDHALIVDGWTGDYYQARHRHKFWHGGVPNPFQLTVRNNIYGSNGHINIKEVVKPRPWDESFSPNFLLQHARAKPSTYEPEGMGHLRLWKLVRPEQLEEWRQNYSVDEVGSFLQNKYGNTSPFERRIQNEVEEIFEMVTPDEFELEDD
jgi:hypothetical protein